METAERRPVRTFHPRRGRMSNRHADAMAELWPRFGLTVEDGDRAPLDLEALFGRAAPKVLEIGFGMGDATADMAQADPGRDYLGVEVHTPGIGNLLALVGERGLTNVRVAHGDAMELMHQLPEGGLDAIHVFFPDPWPKARHHKRRLIQPGNVVLLRRALRAGGVLHCATDWPEYADAMRATLDATMSRVKDAKGGNGQPETKTGRPKTDTEQAGRQKTGAGQAGRQKTGAGQAGRQETGAGQAGQAGQPEANAEQAGQPQTNAKAERLEIKSGRPETKFERRGARAGRPIADLVYQRI